MQLSEKNKACTFEASTQCWNRCKHGSKAVDAAKVPLIKTRLLLQKGQRCRDAYRKKKRGTKKRNIRGGLEGREDRDGLREFREGHSSSFVARPQIFQPCLLTPTPLLHNWSELWRTPIKAGEEGRVLNARGSGTQWTLLLVCPRGLNNHHGLVWVWGCGRHQRQMKEAV